MPAAVITNVYKVSDNGSIALIHVDGTNLGATQNGSTATFFGAAVTITHWENTYIEFETSLTNVEQLIKNFTDLADVPQVYTDAGGKAVTVKSTTDGLEFAAAQSGAGSAPKITAVAGENLTADDIVKIINDGGPKAYKFLSIPTVPGPGSDVVPDSIFSGSPSASPYYNSVKLSNLRLLLTVCNGSGQGTMLYVGTIQAGLISWSSAVQFLPFTAPNNVSLLHIETDKFVVVSRDYNNSYVLKMAVGVVDQSDQISFGATKTFGSGVFAEGVCALGYREFAVTFALMSNPYPGYVMKCTINQDNSISMGTGTPFGSDLYSSPYFCKPVRLTDGKILIAFNKAGGGQNAVVASVDQSGVWSFGATVFLGVESSENVDVCAVRDDRALFAYYASANNRGELLVLSISGNVVTFGTAQVFAANSRGNLSIADMDANRFVVGYPASVSRYVAAVIGSLQSDDSIIFGSPREEAYSHYSQMYSYVRVLTMDVGSFVIVARRNDGSYLVGAAGYTTGVAMTPYAGNILPARAPSMLLGSQGEFDILAPGGLLESPSLALTPLAQYYLDANSRLSQTFAANHYVGVALTPTSLLVDGGPPNAAAAPSTPVALQRI